MPGKKKKAASRPAIQPQDSMRRDIEAARAANLQAVSSNDSDPAAGDGLDVADELMATLDARDRAANRVRTASEDADRLQIPDLHPQKSGTMKSGGSGQSTSADGSHASTSPRRGPGEILAHAGEKLFGRHHSKSPVSGGEDVDESLATDMHRKGSIREKIFGSSPKEVDDHTRQEGARQKMSRQKARKERKAAEAEAQRLQVEAEIKANGGKPDLAEKERVAITELCRSLHVEMKEITPDGHCLYAAVADQLNIQGKTGPQALTYQDTRKATASFMRRHADDFMPFISDSDEHMAGIDNKEAGSQEISDTSKQQQHFMKYCDAVESTGVWGGQPEILALSRAYQSPIHVIQAGSPVVKVGAEESKGEPLMISYHRRMYGLGEHYNSLHKISK